MKIIIAIFTLLMIYLYSIEPIYPVLGFITLIIGAIFYHKYRERQQEIEKLNWYTNNLDNIIEVMSHPGDTEILPRCREHIEWLIKSKNLLRGKVKAVKVYAVIFQSMDVRCFYLDEKNGKTVIAKERINVDKTGANRIEEFYANTKEVEGVTVELNSYQKRCKDFKGEYAMKRAAEIRFMITDKEIEEADEKSGTFYEEKFLGHKPF